MAGLPPPFPEIRALLDAERAPTHTLSKKLRALIEALLMAWPFDEDWYLKTYSDVSDAVRAGKLPSGHEHYIRCGYFESRLPARPEVDDE